MHFARANEPHVWKAGIKYSFMHLLPESWLVILIFVDSIVSVVARR